jgi:hypothetical protein
MYSSPQTLTAPLTILSGHHAKNDVNYTRLARVGKEVEEANPEIKAQFRGNDDIKMLEYDFDMPDRLPADTPVPDQAPYDRTVRMREHLALVFTDPTTAVAGMASTVIDNAIRVATTADTGLLRQLHKSMKIPQGGMDIGGEFVKDIFSGEIPVGHWGESIFAAETQAKLATSADLVKTRVRAMGKKVGACVAPRIAGQSSFEHCYFDFFRSIADTFWVPAEQQQFIGAMASHFGIDTKLHSVNSVDRMWVLLHEHLRSPIPRCVTESARIERGPGDPLETLTRLTHFFSESFQPPEVFATLSPLDKQVVAAAVVKARL